MESDEVNYIFVTKSLGTARCLSLSPKPKLVHISGIRSPHNKSFHAASSHYRNNHLTNKMLSEAHELAAREQCSQSSGAPIGPRGETAKRTGRDGTAKRNPSTYLIPTCRATWENDSTGRQNAVRPHPWISRMAVIRKDNKPHGLRHILVGGGGGRRRTTGTTQFRPSWSLSSYRANSGKDGTGRQNAFRPGL